MEKKVFNIPNISCHHCVMSIKNELLDKEGVNSVSGDPETKNITVEWDAPISEPQIRQVLKEINYPAE